MGTNCAFCSEAASIEFLLPSEWASYVAQNTDIAMPRDGTFSMPVCGSHVHEMHQLKIRYEEQTGFDLTGYDDVEKQVQRTLADVPESAFETKRFE